MLICCITGKYDLITVHKVKKKKNDYERVALSSPIEMIEVYGLIHNNLPFILGTCSSKGKVLLDRA